METSTCDTRNDRFDVSSTNAAGKPAILQDDPTPGNCRKSGGSQGLTLAHLNLSADRAQALVGTTYSSE